MDNCQLLLQVLFYYSHPNYMKTSNSSSIWLPLFILACSYFLYATQLHLLSFQTDWQSWENLHMMPEKTPVINAVVGRSDGFSKTLGWKIYKTDLVLVQLFKYAWGKKWKIIIIIVAEYLEWFSVMFIVGQYFHVPQTPCFSFWKESNSTLSYS